MNYPVILEDLANNEELYSGPAAIEQIANGYAVTIEAPDFTSIWKIYKKGCVIENRAQADVRLILKSGTGGFARIRTEFGTLESPAVLDLLEQNGRTVEVKYHLDGHPDHFHFRMQIHKPDIPENQ